MSEATAPAGVTFGDAETVDQDLVQGDEIVFAEDQDPTEFEGEGLVVPDDGNPERPTSGRCTATCLLQWVACA